jgi:uncharacterized membrane protein
MFIPPTAKYFDTKMYVHVASLLCITAFFGNHQGGIGHTKRKAQHWLIMTWMCNFRVKKQMLKLYKND